MKFLIFVFFVLSSPFILTSTPVSAESVPSDEVTASEVTISENTISEEATSEAVVYGHWKEWCGHCCGGQWVCAQIKPGINE